MAGRLINYIYTVTRVFIISGREQLRRSAHFALQVDTRLETIQHLGPNFHWKANRLKPSYWPVTTGLTLVWFFLNWKFKFENCRVRSGIVLLAANCNCRRSVRWTGRRGFSPARLAALQNCLFGFEKCQKWVSRTLISRLRTRLDDDLCKIETCIGFETCRWETNQ